eukprot:NODE_77_length_23338_cov_0.319463.p13 type:complete len:118 gc:universal NODE_77_length_23338_cov_0.319463:19422-19069(-)
MEPLENEQEDRFSAELEFLSCLANPRYLTFLSQADYLSNPKFIKYLEYLGYFEKEPYRKYVQYPHALYFRRALLSEEFRDIMNSDFLNNYVNAKQYFYYMHQSYKRLSYIYEHTDKE